VIIMNISVAIFVLATFGSNYSSYEKRIYPIVNGWGISFSHLYFVIGRNVHDRAYLDKNCDLTNSRRKLVPHSPQTVSKDVMLKYECSTSNGKKFYSLFSANCTGEYFGFGIEIKFGFNFLSYNYQVQHVDARNPCVIIIILSQVLSGLCLLMTMCSSGPYSFNPSSPHLHQLPHSL
jgi:hypothetical protein